MPTVLPSIQTLADLLEHLGNVPVSRIRFHPAPGTATVRDVIEIQEREGKLCELVEGVLLEKILGYNESCLAAFLIRVLGNFVDPRNLGLVSGADGSVELLPDLIRIPDVAFTNWERPGRRRPTSPVPNVVPNLAVEVLSPSNTSGEMAAKRRDYFAAGVQLVWEVDPSARIVTAYSSPDQSVTLGPADNLEGREVLPGFVLPVRDLFAELDRQG